MEKTSPPSLKAGIKLAEISLLGVGQGLLSLPLEHPLDTLKTWMQSENQSMRQAAWRIHQAKGLKGFYSGFSANCLRVVSKNAYRWPLNIYLMAHFRRLFARLDNQKALAGVATGGVTALLESFIICPLERIKIWLMTSPEYLRFSSFFRAQALRSLMDGFLPVLAKQTVSWVSFLGSQEFFKELAFRYHGKTNEEYELSTWDLTVVSVLVCLCNTACVMPVDFVKTHYQKFSKSTSALPIAAFAREVYRRGGLRLFYRGGAVKIVQYNINAFFTVQIFERVLRAYERN